MNTCNCNTKNFSLKSIPLDCPATYNLIGQGIVKGVFQLEQPLGIRYASVIKPKNLREISDVIALIRPGCKEIGMLDNYISYKNKEKEPEFLHPDLKPILEKTGNVLIYQESIMEICQHIAGFSLKEADEIRKCIGKKLPIEMKSWQDKFTNRCVENKYTQEVAEALWLWLDHASGYLFNLSHSIEYALTAYQTAYVKCHFPLQFYTAMLEYSYNSVDPYQELKELINDAKIFGITVTPPSIMATNLGFNIFNNTTINFGLRHIKDLGDKSLDLIANFHNTTTFEDFLLKVDRYSVNSRIVNALIKSGALDSFGVSRKKMLVQYNLLRSLSKYEQSFVLSAIGSTIHPEIISWLISAIDKKWTKRESNKLYNLHLFGILNKNGISKQDNILYEFLQTKIQDNHINDITKLAITSNPNIIEVTGLMIDNSIFSDIKLDRIKQMLDPYAIIDDTTNERADNLLYEKYYLGIPITSYEVEEIEYHGNVTPCLKVHDMREGDMINVCCMIDNISIVKTKKGKSAGRDMAFINMYDNSYMITAMAFADSYEKYRDILKEGNIINAKLKKIVGNGLIIEYCNNIFN